MRFRTKSIVAVAVVALVYFLGGGDAGAQTIQRSATDIALKNGESTEFMDLYLISTDCKSLLIGMPDVEIMEGPPGVSVAAKPAKVVPRGHSCANAISGGKLTITANGIEEYSRSTMVIRITYKTRSGNRQRSHNIRVTLFP